MEDILIGILKFFGNTIDIITSPIDNRKGVILIFFILVICITIVYILTKDF
jgi:hypothetical protein